MGRAKGFKQPHTGDMSRFASRGLGLQGNRPPSAPTTALPGSRAKLQVMIERLARGEDAHHQDDARDSDDNRGVVPEEQCGADYE